MLSVNKQITHGSLFTGLGGFDLAAVRCGIPTAWQCEKDKFCLKFLDHFFPSVLKFNDIQNFDYEKATKVNIISGGFPCQDISKNGKGKGLSGEKSSLVFKQLEIIDRLRPEFAIFENSPVLIKRGFDDILRHLANIGYDAEWRYIHASEFGYNHERKRLYVVAHAHVSGQKCGVFKPVQNVPVHGYQPTPTYLRVANSPIRTDGDYYDLCGVDGLPRNFRKAIGGFGNAVNVTVAEYVFRCILNFIKENNQKKELCQH